MASRGTDDICESDRHVRFTKKPKKTVRRRLERSYTQRGRRWRVDDSTRHAVVYNEEPSYAAALSEPEQERMAAALEAARLDDEKGDPVEVKRRSKVRLCDFCHKSYIAVVRGNTNVEELPAASPQRLCGTCGYIPAEAKGTLKQEQPGWFIRCATDTPQSGTAASTRTSGKDYREFLEPRHTDSLDPTTSLDEDEMFYAKRLAKIPRVYKSVDCLDKVHGETDASSSSPNTLKLRSMRDCYVSSDRTPSTRAPICERHKKGESGCWVGKDIQDIPESSYRRTADMYERYGRDVYRPQYTSHLDTVEENRSSSSPKHQLPLRRDLPPPPAPPSAPAKPSRNIFE